MLRIWGKLIKNNRIVKDAVVASDIAGSYQDNLKACITELCYKFDIAKPYWLQSNMDEFNRRSKTSFTEHNFVEELYFDKFVIEELKEEKKEEKK